MLVFMICKYYLHLSHLSSLLEDVIMINSRQARQGTKSDDNKIKSKEG